MIVTVRRRKIGRTESCRGGDYNAAKIARPVEPIRIYGEGSRGYERLYRGSISDAEIRLFRERQHVWGFRALGTVGDRGLGMVSSPQSSLFLSGEPLVGRRAPSTGW